MPSHPRPALYRVDDPVAETIALLQRLPDSLLVPVLLVVLARSGPERLLAPAERGWLLLTLLRLAGEAARHRAA